MKRKLPNIIFIVMDTVGAKHMSLYGYPRKTTPNLERIAEECQVYTGCFAPACWTIPSHASMFTGLYPSQHGVHEGNFFLNENIQNLVPALKMAGYQTHGISSNGLVSPTSGLCRDFDSFTDFGDRAFNQFLGEKPKKGKGLDDVWNRLAAAGNIKEKMKIIFKYATNPAKLKKLANEGSRIIKSRVNSCLNPTPFTKSSIFTEKTVTLFKEFLDNHSSKNGNPFFFFINFIEAHTYYKPPLRWRQFSHWYNKQIVSNKVLNKQPAGPSANILEMHQNLYDDELYYLDSIIARIWDLIKNSPNFDDTVFIVTSDHGEHFGEKGLCAHALSLYNELVWVPLIIRFPESFSMKGVDSRLVSLTDLYSTLLDLAQSPLPRPETSISILKGQQRDYAISQIISPNFWQDLLRVKRVAVPDYFPPTMAVVTKGGKKLIETSDGKLQVYDLNKDMAETRDLSPAMPAEVKTNFEQLMDFLKKETYYSQTSNYGFMSSVDDNSSGWPDLEAEVADGRGRATNDSSSPVIT